MVKRGSSCGKPSTGAANFFLMLSPISLFHNWSLIITVKEFVFPVEGTGASSVILSKQEIKKQEIKKMPIAFFISLKYTYNKKSQKAKIGICFLEFRIIVEKFIRLF
jgi:hypothetical protein